jgi:hypothetical protein
MEDIAGIICTFCGSLMTLSREMPAATQTHALRFFACDTCGSSELRLGEPPAPEKNTGSR